MNKSISAVLIAIFCFFIVSCGPSAKELALHQENAKLLQEIEDLKLKNIFLEDSAAKLKLEQARLDQKLFESNAELKNATKIISQYNEIESSHFIKKTEEGTGEKSILGYVNMANASVSIIKLGSMSYPEFINKLEIELTKRIQDNADAYWSLDKQRNTIAKTMREDIDTYINWNNSIASLLNEKKRLPIGYRFDSTTLNGELNSLNSKIQVLNNKKSQIAFRLIENKKSYISFVDKMRSLHEKSAAVRYTVFLDHALRVKMMDSAGNFKINNIKKGDNFLLVADGRKNNSSVQNESDFLVSFYNFDRYESNKKINLSHNDRVSFDTLFKYTNKNIENMFKTGVPDTEELKSLDEALKN
jgi:hypothetical protein